MYIFRIKFTGLFCQSFLCSIQNSFSLGTKSFVQISFEILYLFECISGFFEHLCMLNLNRLKHGFVLFTE